MSLFKQIPPMDLSQFPMCEEAFMVKPACAPAALGKKKGLTEPKRWKADSWGFAAGHPELRAAISPFFASNSSPASLLIRAIRPRFMRRL